MRALTVIIPVALLLAGCSIAQHVHDADAAIDKFHAMLNAGQSPAIYAAASAEMKSSTTSPAFQQFLDAVHRKLGQYRSGSAVGWNDNRNLNGEFLTVNFNAQYDHGTAQENFVYRLDDKGPQLVSYHVNSDALVLN